VEWSWGEEQTGAFESLKQKLCAEPILNTLRKEGCFKLRWTALAMPWEQSLCRNRMESGKTLAYYSATFIEAECNYTVEDREMLAIVKTLDHWCQYLLGAPTTESGQTT